jgi:voltage-gated sodium channel
LDPIHQDDGTVTGEEDRAPSTNPLVQIGDALNSLTRSEGWSNCSLSVVVMAGVAVGMQVGYKMEDNAVLAGLDWFILGFFTFEVFIKVWSFPRRPWFFFLHPVERAWNWFDFIIVVLSMPGVVGSAAAMLRLLRLARVLKIVNKIPKLKVILIGLVSGLSSCAYIMLLMGICFYIYAVLGVSLFRENDPWHFADLSLAFESLFRAATLEDW